MKAVIFDLDDTLIRSKIDFKKMKNKVIEFLQCVGVTHGLLSSRMLNVEIARAAMEELNRKGFSEDEAQHVLAKVAVIMNRVELESLRGAAVIDGVPETLKALKAKGIKIGIMTRSCREYTEKVLARFGLRRYVDAVAARDDVKKPKPNAEHAFHLLSLLGVSVEHAILVGDHWLDANCARESGLRFILVGSRDLSMGALKGYDYQAVNSIRDIINIV